jgi:hypothetical protein
MPLLVGVAIASAIVLFLGQKPFELLRWRGLGGWGIADENGGGVEAATEDAVEFGGAPDFDIIAEGFCYDIVFVPTQRKGPIRVASYGEYGSAYLDLTWAGLFAAYGAFELAPFEFGRFSLADSVAVAGLSVITWLISLEKKSSIPWNREWHVSSGPLYLKSKKPDSPLLGSGYGP